MKYNNLSLVMRFNNVKIVKLAVGLIIVTILSKVLDLAIK